MLDHRAQTEFRSGMQLLARGRAEEALPRFGAAVEIQEQYDVEGRGKASFLSYYGLCLSLSHGRQREALNCCRAATDLEDFNADLWWNRGRVALQAGLRAEAHRALQRGLQLQPGHRGILHDLRLMGVRRGPVLAFLRRDHPINVALGRLCRRSRPARSS